MGAGPQHGESLGRCEPRRRIQAIAAALHPPRPCPPAAVHPAVPSRRRRWFLPSAKTMKEAYAVRRTVLPSAEIEARSTGCWP